MNRVCCFNFISLAAALLLFAGGCANFRKAFSRESSLERSRRPVHRQEKSHAHQGGGERSDDPLFDMVFRKSRKEQQERRMRSELLSPQERSAMEHYHRRDDISGDKDVQKFNREHRFKSDQRDKNWVFGF